MANTIQNLLQKALTANGYAFPTTMLQQLTQYLELLQHWNKAFNLTAIRDAEDMVWLHILDSLAVLPYLHGSRILDVGTGAGLPGIPLAITNPDKQFVLLDSNSKKTRFLTQVKLTLGLSNVEIIHSRCEDFKAPEAFSTIISRAFTSIAVMLAKTQHLIHHDGQFLAMKGVYPEKELQDISPNFVLLGVHKLDIKGLAAERHVVCIQQC
jgi:16S rRNA (guanine527-N7)-methyltransferase